VIAEVWTERTLKLIEDDVMQQSLVWYPDPFVLHSH
jgi:hypothetical protein